MKKISIFSIMLGILILAGCAKSEVMQQPPALPAEIAEEPAAPETIKPPKAEDLPSPEEIADQDTVSAMPVPGIEGVDELAAEPNIVEVNVVAKQWAFEPDTITVSQGDIVRLTAVSEDVAHGLNIPEYGINMRLNLGQSVTEEFTADKKGEFGFFCSVPCGRGHSGMRGKLVVQ